MFSRWRILTTIVTLNTCLSAYGSQKASYESLLPKKLDLRKEQKIGDLSHKLKKKIHTK